MATFGNINFSSSFLTVEQKLELESSVPGFTVANVVVTYNMRGFDSVGGTIVEWTSIGTPNLTPSLTSPPLVGVLQYPHILSKVVG
jgi:hypothetical protein